VSNHVEISGRRIGPGEPTYIVAEMSANHGSDYNRAERIVRAAKESGADAIKFQTYTPDTLTIDCHRDEFLIKDTNWSGRTLYDLYDDAAMPWEWQPALITLARDLGLHAFSTPFDESAVDFLETLDVPAYKIASFEIVDLLLLRKVAATGKPVILSTGMATLAEIDEAVQTLQDGGCSQLILLKCTSAYPALPSEMNLSSIAHLSSAFNTPVGLSDHSLGIVAPVVAVALGACFIEKHFTASRSDPGPDAGFSLEPGELKAMVEAVRAAEQARGDIQFGVRSTERSSKPFRRSLFVIQTMRKGDVFTHENVRSIRPAHGLHPRYLDSVIGRTAVAPIERGTPLSWDLIG
jgi:N-acetylneuraminate synthase